LRNYLWGHKNLGKRNNRQRGLELHGERGPKKSHLPGGSSIGRKREKGTVIKEGKKKTGKESRKDRALTQGWGKEKRTTKEISKRGGENVTKGQRGHCVEKGCQSLRGTQGDHGSKWQPGIKIWREIRKKETRGKEPVKGLIKKNKKKR